MSRFILALDQGTTSSRAILFDHEANPVASAQRPLTQHFPRSGWVEHDAQEIWDCQTPLITAVLAQAGASAADIAADGDMVAHATRPKATGNRHERARRAHNRLAGQAYRGALRTPAR